jgi:hypothetical protein
MSSGGTYRSIIVSGVNVRCIQHVETDSLTRCGLIPLKVIHIRVTSSRCRVPIPKSIPIWVESSHTTLIWSHTHIDILGLFRELLLDLHCLGD